MKKYTKNSIRLLGQLTLSVIFISLLSCASTSSQNWDTLKGTVKNAKNGKPIDDALIVAIWKGHMQDKGETLRVCYHVESAKSDEKGQFSINSWHEQNSYQHIIDKSTAVIVYKLGFWRKNVAQTIPTESPMQLYMETNSNRNQQISPSHRLRYLQKTIGSTACHLDDKDRKNLRELYKSVLNEAKSIAVSVEDKNIVRSIKSWTTFATQ